MLFMQHFVRLTRGVIRHNEEEQNSYNYRILFQYFKNFSPHAMPSTTNAFFDNKEYKGHDNHHDRERHVRGLPADCVESMNKGLRPYLNPELQHLAHLRSVKIASP